MKKILSALIFSLLASMISVSPALAIDPPSGWTYPVPGAPTIVSQSDPFCSEPDKRCDGVSVVIDTPFIPDFDSRYMSALYLKVGTTGASITNGQQGVVVSGLAYAKAHTAIISYYTSEGPRWVTHYGNSTGFTTIAMASTISPINTPTPTPTPTPSTTPTPAPESSTAPTPAPSATPSATPAPISAPAPSVSTNSRIPFTQPCTGGSDRTPGLPQCLMPEGLGGSAWNLVDNNSGVVVNGAVCSEAVCGRNGEWRQWPADRSLNGLLWPNGYPEGATYIQTPFDSAYWGRYFTNGVYEVNGGGIVQPGSSTIVWPVRVEIPRTDTPTVTTESTTSTSTPIQAPVSSGTPTPSPTSGPVTVTPSTPAPSSETQTTVTRVDTTTSQPVAPTSSSSSDDDGTLDEVEAEEEIIDSIEAVVQSNGTTRIQVSTGYLSTALTVVATKKGSKKKYTYKITTNAEGDRKFKSGLNLRGYTVILYKGSTELDRMYIS
jgi:hypothetical protein